jgi:formylglycine-generating enzyme required for sulfatase activity
MIATLALGLTLAAPEVWTQQVPGHLVKFDMVKIPGGSVTIDGKKVDVKPLSVGKTEVSWPLYDIWAFRLDLTQEQQAAGVELKTRPTKPYGAPDYGWGHVGYAAMSITYQSAERFCVWLSEKTGKKYRLPTEAEWQHAAQAGASAAPSPIGDFAWFETNSGDSTHPMGSKQPNAWGLHDTLGNVAEWVARPGADPVVKGGHFFSTPEELTFDRREAYDKSWQLRDPQNPKSPWWLSDGPMIGFRLVCED